MSDWHTLAWIPLGAALLAATLAGPVYLLRTAFGRVGRALSTSSGALDREVRTEAVWGMVLAYPALQAALLCAVGGPWGVAQQSIFAATLCVYFVAALALRSKPLVAPLRWAPAAFAFIAPPIFLAALGLEGEDLLGVALTTTLWGLSYLAWCLVGVRFALAVGRRDRAAHLARESGPLPEPVGAGAADHG